MRLAFAVLLVVHGLIHLFGMAKAFGLAMLPELTQPISPGRGGLWSIAAALLVGSAGALYAAPRWWWLIALGAIAVSSVAIAGSWADAKAGAAVNLIVQVSRMADGTRKVTGIAEITGMEGEVITMQDIFVFERTGIASNGKVIGRFRATGIRPKCSDKINAAGLQLRSDMFDHVKAVA